MKKYIKKFLRHFSDPFVCHVLFEWLLLCIEHVMKQHLLQISSCLDQSVLFTLLLFLTCHRVLLNYFFFIHKKKMFEETENFVFSSSLISTFSINLSQSESFFRFGFFLSVGRKKNVK